MLRSRLVHRLVLIAVAAGLFACDERVTHHYPTRKEAEADQLFERGWLPRVIPASSTGIVTRNNLDHNTSTGEFHFDPAERTLFIGHLTRLPSRDGKNHLGYSFEEWVFLVDRTRGFCRYEFTLDR